MFPEAFVCFDIHLYRILKLFICGCVRTYVFLFISIHIIICAHTYLYKLTLYIHTSIYKCINLVVPTTEA